MNSEETPFSDGWILLTYENGDAYVGQCDNANRTASIMFVCNSTLARKLVFSGQLDDFAYSFQGNPAVLQEHTSIDHHCNYMFQIQVSEMCSVIEKSKKMSGGAIFLIM